MRIARKVFHLSGILAVLLYDVAGLDRPFMAGLLWAAVALLLVLDLLRHRSEPVRQLFQTAFRPLLDPKDERGLNTSTLYFTGCALAVTLFPRAAACAGILALAVGDPAAAILGQSVRSPRWGKVSLAGSLGCFFAAALACRLYFPWPPALAGAAVATLLEAVSGSKLDNLTMPAGTALVLALL